MHLMHISLKQTSPVQKQISVPEKYQCRSMSVSRKIHPLDSSVHKKAYKYFLRPTLFYELKLKYTVDIFL